MTRNDYDLIMKGDAEESVLGNYKGYDCSWEAGFAVDCYEGGIILYNYHVDGTRVDDTLLILDRKSVSLLAKLLKKHGYMDEV